MAVSDNQGVWQMFTGLVTAQGQAHQVQAPYQWEIGTPEGWLSQFAVQLGDSIAVSGVCLTVTSRSDATFRVDVSDETLSCTLIRNWQSGQWVHLEAALRVGDPVGGHWVTGHVDTVARLAEKKMHAGGLELVFLVEKTWGKFLAIKGSVSLDGVSLTLNQSEQLGDRYRFSVCLIPHTQQATHLGNLQIGDGVHLEIDPIARYINQWLTFSSDEKNLAK